MSARTTAGKGALVAALVTFAATAVRAAPSEICPGTCAGTALACGGPADCDGVACELADACLPGLARLIAEVVPEGPGGLNDATHGWTCGLLDCAPEDDALTFSTDYGITAVATKDIALSPGKRYLAIAEMKAEPGTWGYFDIAAYDVGGTSDPAVASDFTRVSAYFSVPEEHLGPLQFRLHADGPGAVAIRRIALLELVDYGVWLRLSIDRAVPARFSTGFILRHAADGPGVYPQPCAPGDDPAICIDPSLTTADAAAGGATDWIEVSRMFGPSPAGWRVTIPWNVTAPDSGAALDDVTVTAEVAYAPDAAAIVWRGERAGPRVGIVLPEGIPSPPDLASTPSFVGDTVASDRAAIRPAELSPEHFRVATFVNTVDLFDSAPGFGEEGLRLLDALGLDAADFFSDVPSAAERALAEELGLHYRFIHAEGLLGAIPGAPFDFDRDALRAAIATTLEDPYWQRELGDAPDPATRFLVLGDEIGGLQIAGPAYRAEYAAWLAAEGVTAAELGLASLDEALPLEDMGWWRVPEVRPDPSDPEAARRYVWALRFWNEATAEVYALGREALAERFGAMPASFNAGTPFGAVYFQAALGADYQAMADAHAVTGFLGEGFLSYLDDCFAWQLGAYADYVVGVTAPWREAATARGETFPLASYLHAYRGDQGAKMLELAARGFTWMSHYAYGPYDLSTGDGVGGLGALSVPWLERVRDGSELLARAEPLLWGATREPSPVVMLASQSDGVWSDEAGLTGEEIGWHIALTQAHLPVDFMLEDEIAQGLLESPLTPRQVLIVLREHVSRAAWAAIQRWVEGGGVVILGGGLASKDEFGQLDTARAEWQLFVASDAVAAGSEEIRWATGSGTSSFTYGGAWRPLESIIGTPIARAEDGRSVVMRVPRGRGRIVALGLGLGESYRVPETTCDGSRPAAVSRRPTDFSPVIRQAMAGLVTAAGVSAPLRSESGEVALHRLRGKNGEPLVLAIPWSNEALSFALTIPDAVRCEQIEDVIAGDELPLTFGSVLVTLEGPALFTWDRSKCRPDVDEPSPEIAEPEPAPRDEGCAGGGAAAWTGLLALVLAQARRTARR